MEALAHLQQTREFVVCLILTAFVQVALSPNRREGGQLVANDFSVVYALVEHALACIRATADVLREEHLLELVDILFPLL